MTKLKTLLLFIALIVISGCSKSSSPAEQSTPSVGDVSSKLGEFELGKSKLQ